MEQPGRSYTDPRGGSPSTDPGRGYSDPRGGNPRGGDALHQPGRGRRPGAI